MNCYILIMKHGKCRIRDNIIFLPAAITGCWPVFVHERVSETYNRSNKKWINVYEAIFETMFLRRIFTWPGFCQNVFGQKPLDAAYMSGSEVTCVPETQMQMDTVDQFSDFHCEELDLYAKSAVLTDADTGRILYGKEANSPMSNASTTKIMTCLLAIESGKTGDSVTFSEYACSMPKVRLGCSVGTQFLLEDLLYSLMLESHNDTAVAIAEYVAGSVQHFAVQMNERAAELGCLDTHFVTPNGLE